MFTGIITDLGRVRRVEPKGDARVVFETGAGTADLVLGTSVACSGACLTVVDKGPDWFAADVSAETLSKTTLGGWGEGSPVNLGRARKLGGALGGHLVSGHVDGVGRLCSRAAEGDSLRLVFEAPAELGRCIAPKGSVAVDGVSLTVNEVKDRDGGATRFGVNIIPRTAQETTLGALRDGDPVNLEIDLLARYVQRLLGKV